MKHQLLLEMLTHKRPAYSYSVMEFIKKYIEPLGGKYDPYGNTFVVVGEGSTMFTSHTDTVHSEGGIQKVTTDGNHAWTEESNCLGADDTVGIWLMIKMIEAGVEGVYAFFQDEEVGGLGSHHVADRMYNHDPYYDFLGHVTNTVSLDRLGFDSVITHQGERCCSDAYADSLIAALNEHGLDMKKDDSGLFTDSANFVGIIPENTNLSVGYFDQHRPTEYTDLNFAEWLLEALIAVDWSSLVIKGVNSGVYDRDEDMLEDWFEPSYNGYIPDSQIVDVLAEEHPDIYDEIVANLEQETVQ